MFIEKIQMKNYRQYREETIIELGVQSTRNINVIVGSNGAGKTNLSNAIQWCFYGKEPSLKEGLGFGILNMNAFKELQEGKIAEVVVEVTIVLDNGEKYAIQRVKQIIKTKDRQETVPYSESREPDGSKLTAYFCKNTKAKSPSFNTDFPARLINILAPEKISEYFFFDGEKLDKYFAASSKEEIKEAVFQISQLDLLAIIEERLNVITRDYRQEIRGVVPEAEKTSAEIESIDKKLENIKNEIVLKQKNLAVIKEKKSEIMQEYKELGGEHAKELLKRNEEIVQEIEQKEKELSEKEKEKNYVLVENAYLFWGAEVFKDSLKFFDIARQKGIFPPNITPDFVKELLKKGSCICKTDISEKNKDKEPRQSVEELLQRISSGMGSMVGELLEKEKDMFYIKKSKLESCLDKINLLNKPIKEYRSQIDRLQRDLDNNNSKLRSGAKLDKLENFDQTIKALDDESQKLAEALGALKAKEEESQYELKNKKEEFEKQAKKEKKGREINNLIEFCERSKAHASSVKSKIMDEIRQEISKETEEHYHELHWKEGEKIDIRIDEDYQIYAFQDDHNKFGTFAAGERALLAMSFMVALNHVSGFRVPIIMDTALGRISSEPRKNFSKNIATYLKNNQIILLFTQSEFSPEVKENLLSAINHQYIINLPSPLEAEIKEKK